MPMSLSCASGVYVPVSQLCPLILLTTIISFGGAVAFWIGTLYHIAHRTHRIET
jgi:hypothetical protein